MMDEKILIDILDSNEKRAKKQLALIKKYRNSLISFTLNIPGRVKDNRAYRDIHIEGMNVIVSSLKSNRIDLIYREEEENPAGRAGYLVVDEDSYILKKLAIEIEEMHPLGRIFDIDIFSGDNRQINRSNLGNISRRCLLCDNDARVCMRMKNHTYESLIESIDDKWIEYMDKNKQKG